MRHYELTCLGELNSLEEKITSLIQKGKGVLTEARALRNLVVFNFQMEPEGLIEFEKNLKLEKEISRFMILAKKPSKPQDAVNIYPRVTKPKQKVQIQEIEKKLEEILKE